MSAQTAAALIKAGETRLKNAGVEDAGFDPYERRLLGITAMTSLLGKKKFNDLLAPFVAKGEGKPTLAPRSDKRPEFFAASAPAEDFS